MADTQQYYYSPSMRAWLSETGVKIAGVTDAIPVSGFGVMPGATTTPSPTSTPPPSTPTTPPAPTYNFPSGMQYEMNPSYTAGWTGDTYTQQFGGGGNVWNAQFQKINGRWYQVGGAYLSPEAYSPTRYVEEKYTVQPGDTLYSIAQKYGVNWHDITGFSSGNPNIIKPGEVLTIPRYIPQTVQKWETNFYNPPTNYPTTGITYNYQQTPQTQQTMVREPTNLYEYYTQQGKPLPSITERAALYQQAGLGPATSYLGTTEQNNRLLNYLLGKQPTGAGVITTQSTKPANPVEGSIYDDTQTGIRYRYTNGQWQPIQSIPKVSTSGESSSKQVSEAGTFDVDVQEYMRKWGIQGTPEDYARSIGIKNYTGTIDQKAQIINDIAKKGPAGLLNTTPITTTSEGASTTQSTIKPDVYRQLQDEIAYYSNIKTLSDLKKSLGIDDTTKPTVPNLSADLLKLRNQYGVDAIEARINDLNKLISDTEASLRQGIYNEEGKLQPMTLMSAREQALRRQAQEQLDAYNREKAVLVDEYNTKQSLINNLMTLENRDYENAKAAYDTNFSQNLQLQQMLITSADKIQDNARANLTLITNAIKDKNLTFDQLDPALQAQISKLEMQAGIPVGTIEMFLKAKPDSTLLAHGTGTDANGNEFVYLVYKDNATGAIKTTNVYTGGVKTSSTVTHLSKTQQSKLLGLGLTSEEIQSLDKDLGSYPIDTILKAQTGWSDNLKTQIKNVILGKAVEEEGLSEDEFKNQIREYRDKGVPQEQIEQSIFQQNLDPVAQMKALELIDEVYSEGKSTKVREWWNPLTWF